MAQTIKLKRSATAGAVPTTSQLELGEVAINTADGKMYIKKSVGGVDSIVDITGGGGGSSSADTILQEFQFTASANQTTFSGSDDNSEAFLYTPDAIQVFLNGILLDSGVDYTASNGTSVVLSEVVDANDYLQVFAFKQKISDGSVTVNTFTGNGSTTAFTLSIDPGDENNTRVYIDGVYQSKSNYAVSGTTLTFSTAPPNNTAIEVEIGNRNVTLDTTANLDLPDNVKLRLGTGQDTDFYHDGTDTYLRNQTGQLLLRGNDTKLQSYLGETYATFANNGAATLYYDNSAKLATFSGGVSVTGQLNATTMHLPDGSTGLQLGASNDTKFFHDGNNSKITHSGSGGFYIGANTFAIQKGDHSENYLAGVADGAVEIYHNGVKKVETTSTGATVTGTLVANSVNLGDSEAINIGASDDFQLYHDGSNSYIYDAGTGYMVLMSNGPGIRLNRSNADVMIDATPGGSSSLWYDGNKKIETSSTGATITGTLASDTFQNASGNLNILSTGNILLKFDSDNNQTNREFNLQSNSGDQLLNITETGAATFNGSITANAGVVVDNITIDGNEIDVSSGNLTLDVAGDITLDADGRDVYFADGGTNYFQVYNDVSNNVILNSVIQDKDIKFTGNDGGATITALTLDMSDGGAATFNNDILLSDGRAARFGNNQDFRIYNDGSHTSLINATVNQDILFRGNDDGSMITALTLDMSNAGKATFSGIVSNPTGFEVGNMFIMPNEIDVSSGNLTLDVAGEIILDSDAEFVRIYHDGGWIGGFQLTNNDFIVRSAVQDKDLIFRGNDGGSTITALTLDMSNAGYATFNSTVKGTDGLFTGNGDIGLDVRMGTDKRLIFQGNMGEVGNVAGFQAANTAGSANTPLGIRATDIRFATGSAERVRITDTGLGVNDQNPDRKVSIVGDSTTNGQYPLSLDATNTDYTLEFRRNGTSEWWIKQAGSSFNIHENGVGDHFRILAGGNIGIGGVTNPLSPLSVQADSGAGVIRFIGRSADNIASMGFYNNAQTLDVYQQSNGYWMRSRADGGFHFRKGGTPVVTDADGFTINGMNLGVGTADPTCILEAVNTGEARIKARSTNNNWAGLDLESHGTQSNYIFFRDNSAERARIQVLDGNDMIFSMGSSPDEKMRLSSGGRLGIGTQGTPRYELQVKGNNTTAIGIALDNDSGSGTADLAILGSGYNSHQAGAGEVWLYSPDNINIGGASGNTNDIKFIGNNNVRMRIQGSDGKVIVGNRFQPNEHIIFGSNTGYLQFPGSSGRAWAMASSGGTAAPGTQSATFGFHHWSGSAWTNPVNISASGKLGVGTSNPVARGLDVLTTSSNTFTPSNDSWHSLVVRNDAAAATNCVGLAFNVSGGYHQNAGTGIAAVKNGTNSDHGAHLVFVTRPQSAVAEERMRITDAGKVGIATNDPQTPLDVRNSANTTGKTARFVNTGTSVDGITVGTSTGDSSGRALHLGHNNSGGKGYVHGYNYGSGAWDSVEVKGANVNLRASNNYDMVRIGPNFWSLGGGTTSHGRVRSYHHAVSVSAGTTIQLLTNNSGAHTDVNFLYWIEAYHSGRTYRTGVGTFGGYGLYTQSAGQGINFSIADVSTGVKRLEWVASSSFNTIVYIGMIIFGDTSLTVHNGTLADMI